MALNHVGNKKSPLEKGPSSAPYRLRSTSHRQLSAEIY